MDQEGKKELPGITLWHKGAKRYEVAGKQKVEVRLEGDINDEQVWRDVEKKFIDGFPVYTVEDFKGEMLQAFRAEVKELEEKNTLLARQNERLAREKILLEAELEKARAPLVALSNSLKR
jgi:hypothetical protein